MADSPMLRIARLAPLRLPDRSPTSSYLTLPAKLLPPQYPRYHPCGWVYAPSEQTRLADRRPALELNLATEAHDFERSRARLSCINSVVKCSRKRAQELLPWVPTSVVWDLRCCVPPARRRPGPAPPAAAPSIRMPRWAIRPP